MNTHYTIENDQSPMIQGTRNSKGRAILSTWGDQRRILEGSGFWAGF